MLPSLWNKKKLCQANRDTGAQEGTFLDKVTSHIDGFTNEPVSSSMWCSNCRKYFCRWFQINDTKDKWIQMVPNKLWFETSIMYCFWNQFSLHGFSFFLSFIVFFLFELIFALICIKNWDKSVRVLSRPFLRPKIKWYDGKISSGLKTAFFPMENIFYLIH